MLTSHRQPCGCRVTMIHATPPRRLVPSNERDMILVVWKRHLQRLWLFRLVADRCMPEQSKLCRKTHCAWALVGKARPTPPCSKDACTSDFTRYLMSIDFLGCNVPQNCEEALIESLTKLPKQSTKATAADVEPPTTRANHLHPHATPKRVRRTASTQTHTRG